MTYISYGELKAKVKHLEGELNDAKTVATIIINQYKAAFDKMQVENARLEKELLELRASSIIECEGKPVNPFYLN